jgi:hypothetical protein
MPVFFDRTTISGAAKASIRGGCMAAKALLAVCAIASVAMVAATRPARAADSVIYSVDFSGYSGGSVLRWLASKEFLPQQDANNGRRVVYSILHNDLVLETRSRAFAVLFNETDVRDYSRIRIEWGVDAFPAGASYAGGVRSEAIMVYVFFGKERHASGSLLIPDSPYFLGLFLCESDATDKPFRGRYYHAIGRYICVDRPSLGVPVTTDFPIAEAFTRVFGQNPPPDISGFGIAIDTANLRGNGVAKSLIRKIEFVR